MQSSARDTGDFGSSTTTGRPAFTDIGTAMSSGTGKFALEPEHPLDLLDVELHLGVRVVQHELELRARDRLEVERLHPDLQVLDARDVHAADEEHLVGRLDAARARSR